MPTINQLIRKGRKPKKALSKAPQLQFTTNSLKGGKRTTVKDANDKYANG